ncbi:hypothetical protein [Streptomyces sp. MP131-18]|uniref:hypothetical protein n=1 Tax=Streptomyces sp. MP131-18 TaxID=1857892 RepID=UPI00097CBA51|nr:hypothetical protein [Streptomyces sp. MP131-18]ONK13265.1 hypothetical protein STBA_40280 [Streptomyces sp. MP131-18]
MDTGDIVRVVVDIDGHTEHHFGVVERLVKKDGTPCRRKTSTPYAAVVSTFHAGTYRRPLSEITPEITDFEIITDHAEVHRGGPEHNYGIFHCMGCPRPFPMPADLMVIHKPSGNRRRLCTTHHTPYNRAQLGAQALFEERGSRQSVAQLTEQPDLITGPLDDYESNSLRSWADTFPRLVPDEAARKYAAWKESRT